MKVNELIKAIWVCLKAWNDNPMLLLKSMWYWELPIWTIRDMVVIRKRANRKYFIINMALGNLTINDMLREFDL